MDDQTIEFGLVYPMFFAFAEKEGQIGYAGTGGSFDGTGIAIFTDSDLAFTYVGKLNAEPDCKYQVSNMDTPIEFLEFLKGAAEDGFTHAVFDPGQPNIYRPTVEISYLISAVENGAS